MVYAGEAGGAHVGVCRMKILLLTALLTAAANATVITAERIDTPAEHIRITLDSGKILTFPKGQGVPALDPPQISRDRRSVAWAEEDYADASYTIPFTLSVWRGGKLFYPDCVGGAPLSWGFVGGGATIRVDCSFPHGKADEHRLLFDIRTSKLLAREFIREDPSSANGCIFQPAQAWARKPDDTICPK